MLEILTIIPLLFLLISVRYKNRKLNRIILFIYIAILYLTAFLCLSNNEYFISTDFFSVFFTVDPISKLLFALNCIIFSGVAVHSIFFLKNSNDNRWDSYYISFILIFSSAVTASLFANHLGLLWVCIETATLSSAVLIYYDRTKASLEAVWKYIFVCSIGISFAFVGIIILLIASSGYESLFLSDININISKFSIFWLKLSYVFLIIGFGTKMGLAPVHTWMPDTYSETPSPVSAMMSGIFLNSAFLAIFRITSFTNKAGLANFTSSILMFMGILSVVVSALFLLRVRNYRRLLAYSSIENMGIISIGLASGGLALYGSIFHTIIHSLVKASLFFSAGLIYEKYRTKEIASVRGMVTSDPLTGWVWMTGIIAVSAFPPFAMFNSEFIIITKLFSNGNIIKTIILLILLTVIIFCMISNSIKMCFYDIGIKESIKSGIAKNAVQILFLLAAAILSFYIPDFMKDLINKVIVGYK